MVHQHKTLLAHQQELLMVRQQEFVLAHKQELLLAHTHRQQSCPFAVACSAAGPRFLAHEGHACFPYGFFRRGACR